MFNPSLCRAAGTDVTLRPVRPDDHERMHGFITALSVGTRRHRFHGMLNGRTGELLDLPTGVDGRQRVGWVATRVENGVERILGDARYVVTQDGTSAEFALVVADTWQSQGIGRWLMQTLMAQAQSAGLRWMFGEVLERNARAQGFLQHLGFSARAGAAVEADERSVCMERGLQTQAGALAAAGAGGLLRHWLAGRPDHLGKPPVKWALDQPR
jgi:ribosomal protein S18 acetylase RimI-like enzyme